MQHHGAPSRLLDFTYSIYVAAYFALEGADHDCAIWAINGQWALKGTIQLLTKAGKRGAARLDRRTTEEYGQLVYRLLFTGRLVPCVTTVNPFRLNERIRTQKGVFAVPGDITIGFMDNLQALPNHHSGDQILKLIIPIDMRRDALIALHDMNINSKSLFPGLDGYARSLGIYHPSFIPARRGRKY